jgi:transcription initiation factor IIF auxiliary subunit
LCSPDKAPVDDQFPIRNWSIEVYLVGDKGQDLPATVFDSVRYELHQSFGKRARQVKKEPPFRISEEGWGEFEMNLVLTPAGKGAEQYIQHDLNFSTPQYEVVHDMVRYKQHLHDYYVLMKWRRYSRMRNQRP